jgi:hypothetical protein
MDFYVPYLFQNIPGADQGEAPDLLGVLPVQVQLLTTSFRTKGKTFKLSSAQQEDKIDSWHKFTVMIDDRLCPSCKILN